MVWFGSVLVIRVLFVGRVFGRVFVSSVGCLCVWLYWLACVYWCVVGTCCVRLCVLCLCVGVCRVLLCVCVVGCCGVCACFSVCGVFACACD